MRPEGGAPERRERRTRGLRPGGHCGERGAGGRSAGGPARLRPGSGPVGFREIPQGQIGPGTAGSAAEMTTLPRWRLP